MKRFLLFLMLFACLGCGEKKNNSPYSIGRDQTWFPIELEGRAANLNAFTNALIQEISKEENIALQFIDTDWLELFASLDNGEVAGIFSALSPNVVTEDKYSFSNPIVTLGPVLIVPYNSPATSLSDLDKKIVAVNQFDDSVLIVQNYPSIVIQLYQSMPSILEALNNGELDAVVMPILEAQALIPSVYPKQLKIVTPPLNNKAIRLITLKGSNQALMKHFNRGLKQMLSTGRYQALREQYQLN